MGPISVTPIGGSGRSVKFIPATVASSEPGATDVDDRSPESTVTSFILVVPAVLVVMVDETSVTEIVGNTAARPTNLAMIDGESPNKIVKNKSQEKSYWICRITLWFSHSLM